MKSDRTRFALAVAVSLAASGALFVGRFRSALDRPVVVDTAPPPAETAAAPPVKSAAPEPPPPPPPYVHVDPEGARACREGMLLVDGVRCPFVAHHCALYESEAEDICKIYESEVICEGRLQRRRFCIDVFEYPNLEGVTPAASIGFEDAERACAVEGKRLCTTEEWEFACEGSQMWPYPYGISRDDEACNIDRADPPQAASAPSDDPGDPRVRSGERPRCVSPFGVRDLTGNVAEWTINPNGTRAQSPYRSALKGGAWGAGPARCRGETTHPETWTARDVGFRCCADAPKPAAYRSPPDGQTGPRKLRLRPPELD